MITRKRLIADEFILVPLEKDDFNVLYEVASDPKIWEQHPNKDRWKKDVFEVFFDGAIQSNGAYKIVNNPTGEVMGSTRFYEYDQDKKTILIGYTFYAVKYWGKGINLKVKKLQLDYIFQFVDVVYFHIGSNNIRSQKAIERLGVEKVRELPVEYYGEEPKLNFEYVMTKEKWLSLQK